MLNLKFAPFPELKTERLLLRRMRDEDTQLLFEFRSDPNVMRYVGRPSPKNVEEVQELVDSINLQIDQNEIVFWGIELQETANFCGSIGFWRIDQQEERAEIGYLLGTDYWQKGIMTEALKAVVDYGFSEMELHAIKAEIEPENIASARLLQKLRFRKDESIADEQLPSDGANSTDNYVLLAAHWRTK